MTSKVPPRTIPALQRTRAREMRNNATPAERALWTQLRGSRLAGHKFSRQIAVGPFICDLVCRQAKLVIELDGSLHGGPDDLARTRCLEAEGYQVLRFENAQVRDHLSSVLAVIEERLGEMALLAKTPPPAPPAAAGDAFASTGRGEKAC